MSNNSFRKFNQNATKLDLASIELLKQSRRLPTTDNPPQSAESQESFFFELPDFRSTDPISQSSAGDRRTSPITTQSASANVGTAEQADAMDENLAGSNHGAFEYREHKPLAAPPAIATGFEYYAQFDFQRSLNENHPSPSIVTDVNSKSLNEQEPRLQAERLADAAISANRHGPAWKSEEPSAAHADVPEQANDWTTERPENATVRPRPSEPQPPTTSPPPKPSAERAKLMGLATSTFYEQSPALIQRLLQRQEKMGCPIILISDVDQPLRAADICVKLAFELAHQSGKRILVIDADTENQLLSRNSGLPAPLTGLTDIFRGECLMEGTTRPTENPAVSFLCNGKRALNFRLAHASIETIGQKVIGNARQDFDFVCVTTGTAFDGSLALWGRYCDVTFVTLDPTRTSRTLAKAAVGELQRAGARIEGCITVYDKQVA